MNRGLAATAGITLLVVFVVASFESVVRRAENYSYYPAYSSLNNEGTGLKAYYEALVRLGLPVSRNYRPFGKLEGQTATVIYAGTNLGDFRFRSEKELEQFERVAQGGARVLILFQMKETRHERVSVSDQALKEPPGKRLGTSPEEVKPLVDVLRSRWGVEERETYLPNTSPNPAVEALAPSVVRRDVLWQFAKWNPLWKPVLLSSLGAPILLERNFGQGSIGLLAGVEPFTNAQLLKNPDASLLAITMTGGRPLIFDEAHLGVAETDTVAGLARQHHMEWILLGLLAVAALYVWRNAVSFVPPPPSASEADVRGRDAHSALTSLLAQSVSREGLLKEISAECKRSERYVPSVTHVEKSELEQLACTSVAGAPEAYRTLARRKAATRDGYPGTN
jgi:hypothetical protein